MEQKKSEEEAFLSGNNLKKYVAKLRFCGWSLELLIKISKRFRVIGFLEM
jgi:hypothetical protein